MPHEQKKLYRSRSDRIILGVCGGLGKHFDVDPTIVRILFVLLVFADGIGFLAYIIMAFLIPAEPAGPRNVDRGEKVKEFVEDVGHKASTIASEVTGKKSRRHSKDILGVVVIIVGLLLLVHQVFPLYIRWDIVWPLLIIAVGFYLLTKQR